MGASSNTTNDVFEDAFLFRIGGKKLKKKLVILGIILGVGWLSVACTSRKEAKNNDNKPATTIRVGTSPGPYSELFLTAVRPELEKAGYEIKQTEFSELIQADIALSEGAIDLNVDQHTAYLKNFNENKGTDLVGITAIPTVPAGLFPGRKKALDAVKKGDKVAIPDDASNTARAYNLLQKAGWLTLKAGTDPIKATKESIAENPKQLEIIQMSSAQIPRSLVDIDYAVIPGSVVYSAQIDAKESLLSEDVLPDYELVATVNGRNKDADWAKAVVAAYHSKSFKEYMQQENKDNYWFIPND